MIEKGTILNLNNEVNINTDYGNSYYNAISINANIVNGNSGGAVFNKNNELIGIISLKEENSNTGFYIPISNVIELVTKLENRTLIRPNLGGMFASSSNRELLNKYEINIQNIEGVVVLDVIDGYPLNNSGIIKGDVIIKINNVLIPDVTALQKEIYSHVVGETLCVEYYRNNNLNVVNVILSK